MLQQTTVAAVIPYFEKFTARWPDIMALASADDADVMAEWAGLGYYARARNMLKCARLVVDEHGGSFPQEEDMLRRLPGIGPYTAAAIAAIAFGRRAVVVDANVERVISRLFAIDTPLPAARPAIRVATDMVTPDMRSGDFAQAMMDLGAGFCNVRSPECTQCPVSRHCRALSLDRVTDFPVKPVKKEKPVRHGTAYWMENAGRVWLVRRDADGMLGNMRALPDDGWTVRADGHGRPPFATDWTRLENPVRHSFTHFTLLLSVAVAKGPDEIGEGEYWPINSLDKAGLPTLFSKAVRLAMKDGGNFGREKSGI